MSSCWLFHLKLCAKTLRVGKIFPKDLPVISTLKGIEVETQLRMTEVAQQVLEIDKSRFGLITGPNLANEIIMRQPAGAVAASENPANIDVMSEIFLLITSEFIHQMI